MPRTELRRVHCERQADERPDAVWPHDGDRSGPVVGSRSTVRIESSTNSSLGALDPDVDRAVVGRVLELVIEDLEGSEAVNWQRIISEVTGMLHEFPFRIPPDIVLVLRVGSNSESGLRQLDPEFDFLAAAQTFLREHGFMERAARMKLEGMRGELETSLGALLRLQTKLERELDARAEERMQAVVRNPQPDSRSLGYELLAAASLVGTALLATVDITYALVGGGVTIVFIIPLLTTANRPSR